MAFKNTSYKATVTELADNRYNWVVNCNGNPPCGWQGHTYNAIGKPDKETDAIDTAIAHICNKHGYTPDEARKAITVVKLVAVSEAPSITPAVPPPNDKSRVQAIKPTPPPAKPAEPPKVVNT